MDAFNDMEDEIPDESILETQKELRAVLGLDKDPMDELNDAVIHLILFFDLSQIPSKQIL